MNTYERIGNELYMYGIKPKHIDVNKLQYDECNLLCYTHHELYNTAQNLGWARLYLQGEYVGLAYGKIQGGVVTGEIKLYMDDFPSVQSGLMYRQHTYEQPIVVVGSATGEVRYRVDTRTFMLLEDAELQARMSYPGYVQWIDSFLQEQLRHPRFATVAKRVPIGTIVEVQRGTGHGIDQWFAGPASLGSLKRVKGGWRTVSGCITDMSMERAMELYGTYHATMKI